LWACGIGDVKPAWPPESVRRLSRIQNGSPETPTEGRKDAAALADW
jgi:hypothetical protein